MNKPDSTSLRAGFGFCLIMLSLMSACLWLGFWQLDRMHEKQILIDTFEQGDSMSLGEAISTRALFARIEVTGRYSTKWHLLLDNKILNGQVGVHVFSMFYPLQGSPILINRGWLPLAVDRRSLPDIPTPAERISLTGILSLPVVGGVRLGDPDLLENLQGTRLITYLDLPIIQSATRDDLSSWVVLLEPESMAGFQGRNWQPAVMLPGQHRAYAVQWFALALALIIMWLLMSRKRPERDNQSRDTDSASKGQNRE